jgi:hypothetical protein
MNNPTNKTTRPGGHRNGSANTQEGALMFNTQATAPVDSTATIPGWAVVGEFEAWANLATYRLTSTISFGWRDSIGRPTTEVLELVQCDYTERPAAEQRQDAHIEFPQSNDALTIADARTLHTALGDLLARYDAAPSTPVTVYGEKNYPWNLEDERARRDIPCLPGCTENHDLRPNAPKECNVFTEHGEVPIDGKGSPLLVRSYARTEGTIRNAFVGVLSADDTCEDEKYLDVDDARKLAALLLEAATVAERIAATPVTTGGAA